MLEEGTSANISDYHGRTPLEELFMKTLHYVISCEVEMDIIVEDMICKTEKILESGISPNMLNTVEYTTPFIMYMQIFCDSDCSGSVAICSNIRRLCSTRIVELLLKYGAYPEDGLHTAVRMVNNHQPGSMEILRLLVNNTVNIYDNTPPCGFDLLSSIVYLGEPDMVRNILQAGADPNINIEQCGSLPVFWATMRKDDDDDTLYEILDILFTHGARVGDVNLTHIIKQQTPSLNPFVDICTVNRLIMSDKTKSAKLVITHGADIGNIDASCNMLTPAIKKGYCDVASAGVEAGAPLAPRVGHPSHLSFSRACPDTARLVLGQLTFLNISMGEMIVEIGDELYYNLLPELDGKVLVINWRRQQWFTYELDTEARDILDEKSDKENVDDMVVVVPHPHAFFLMVDFRIFLLSRAAQGNSSKEELAQKCQREDSCQKVPDVFTVVYDRLADMYLALDFFAPVFESLAKTFENHENNFVYNILENRKIIFFTFLVVFMVVCLPINTITYMVIKYYMKPDTNQEEIVDIEAIIQEETRFIPDQCKYETENSGTPQVKEESFNVFSKRYGLLYIFLIIVGSSVMFLLTLFSHQLGKQCLNKLVEYLIDTVSYKTAVQIVASLKFLNLLVIDYQPGSPCAGKIFTNNYNTRLAFYMFDSELVSDELNQQIDTLQQVKNNVPNCTNIVMDDFNNISEAFNNVDKEYEKVISI